MVENCFLVMIGAGIGAWLRYLVLTYWPFRFPSLTGVWAVNILGSFILGITVGIHQGGPASLLVQTGFLGGLTTFSTMMTEAGQKNSLVRQVWYLSIQVGAGLLAFLIGQSLPLLFR